MRFLSPLLIVALLVAALAPTMAQELTYESAETALNKAIDFFERQVSVEGAYLWRYSADLKKREGESRADKTQAWVQPPGTPTVGRALLDVYKLTGKRRHLEAARRTARALVRGQLRSGGWDYRIEFNPTRRSRYAYRGETGKGRNVTTLDDNTTQSALTYLILFDEATGFRDKLVHDAVVYGLDALLKAQYPNGAWPQRYADFPNRRDYPVVKANFPKSWSRTYLKRDYRRDYTFNDNTIADLIDLMFLAADVYDQPKYRAAAERAGDFIILAQMPEPQPAWAQQYTARTQPAWARKFEPPAVTGGESQQVLRVLLRLYEYTGKRKYLAPIPSALAYLKRSALPDGRLARFYELKTNKPLYFTRKYELTYSSADMPTHYAFIVGSRLDSIQSHYQRLLRAKEFKPRRPGRNIPKARMSSKLRRQASRVVQALDQRGAWVKNGKLKYHGKEDETRRIIETGEFAANIRILARYLSAAKRDK